MLPSINLRELYGMRNGRFSVIHTLEAAGDDWKASMVTSMLGGTVSDAA